MLAAGAVAAFVAAGTAGVFSTAFEPKLTLEEAGPPGADFHGGDLPAP